MVRFSAASLRTFWSKKDFGDFKTSSGILVDIRRRLVKLNSTGSRKKKSEKQILILTSKRRKQSAEKFIRTGRKCKTGNSYQNAEKMDSQ